MRRALAPLAVAAVAVATLTAAPPASAAAPSWHACGASGLQCATLSVPADWSRPGGRTVTLSLARLPGTDPAHRLGSVLFNPGGPGGDGIPDLARAAGHLTALRTRFDVVTWNPRGGDSWWPRGRQQQDCWFTGTHFEAPADRAAFAALSTRNRATMQACRRHDPMVYDHLSSITHARDLDAIRAAVGDRRLNYLGQSYGGQIGATYARLFPHRVRTMFLDGAVDLTLSTADDDRTMLTAEEQNFTRFATWCANTAGCHLHGRNVPATWRALVASADRTPIPLPNSPTGYTGLDLEQAIQPFLAAGRFTELDAAIDQARHGNATGIAAPAHGGTPMFPNTALATECADGDHYRDDADYQASLARGRQLAPDFPRSRAAWRTKCTGWPLPIANPMNRPLPRTLPPLLGAGTWTDGFGPRHLTSEVPGSSMITVNAFAHGLYMSVGNPCVITAANTYFINRTVPPKDTSCPS